MKKGKPIIALAQIKYFDESKDNNVEKIKKYIKFAKKEYEDIVCFPESCVHRKEILHFNHKLINDIKEECKKNSIWCIINEDMKIDNKMYNTAILINRTGKIKGNYRKINLYGDTEGLNAGKRPKVFKTDFARIGIAICWDLAYPKLFRKMKMAGAEIVFCPSHWAYETKVHEKDHKEREIKIIESLIRARAFENLFFVALCNPITKYKDQIAYSAIASPHRILKELIDKEGLLISEINLSEIKKSHKIYEEAR